VCRFQIRDVNHLIKERLAEDGTTLTNISLTEQSASGDSDYIAALVRMKDALDIKFKRSVSLD